MSRQEIYQKYIHSDIFSNAQPVVPQKTRPAGGQSPLSSTKKDIFPSENVSLPEKTARKDFNHLGIYKKLYGSDIFCQTIPNDSSKRPGMKKIRNANNLSSCFDCMKNEEEYKKNLENYTSERRKEKTSYKPDKYLKYETPAERYFKEMYENKGNNTINAYKEKYIERKKNLKKDTNKLNDEISDIKANPKNIKNYYVKKKNKWTEKNSGNYHYIDNKINPANNAKINKQINLQSNLFKDQDITEKTKTIDIDKIRSRLEEEKNKINQNNSYHIGITKKNISRDLTNNDRSLYGAVHSKWEKSNIDWLNPQTELMFGNLDSKNANSNFGPNGPTPFQRKLNQLADTKNIDTINENKKKPLNNIVKPVAQNIINDLGNEKVDKALEEIPNLKQDKKFKIKMETSTSLLNNDNDWDRKVQTLNNFYTNPNKDNFKIKGKKEVTGKIGYNKDINKNEKKEKSGYGFTEYILTYGTKDQFEKFGENEIKKIFEKNGVHIYDVRKNMFDRGGYNTINFKVGDNKELNIDKKINDIENNLSKNYKVKINKEKKKDVKINYKNFINNPGSKVGVLNENIGKDNNTKFNKMPKQIMRRKDFSRQFEQINHGYKKNK